MSLCLAPSAPRNLQVTNANKTSLQLQWIEPEILNGIILHYKVCIAVLMGALTIYNILTLASHLFPNISNCFYWQ